MRKARNMYWINFYSKDGCKPFPGGYHSSAARAEEAVKYAESTGEFRCKYRIKVTMK